MLAVVALPLALLAAVVVGSHSTGAMPPSAPTGSVPGSYNAVSPARVLDTRTGVGAARAALAANAQIAVPILGRGGVPGSNVSAVVLTVTAVSPTAAGGVTAWADGTAKPATSALSFLKGISTANLVLAQVGGDGKVRLSNNSPGTVQLVGDLAGYYVGGTPVAAGTTVATAPARVLDTRLGVGAPKTPVAAGHSITVPVSGHAGVPATGASAVLVTITALTPPKSGAVTVWAAGASRPATSNISLTAGRTAADLVAVPLGAGGAISIVNNTAASVNLVGDVAGYVVAGTPAAGGTMSTIPPARSLDTRTGIGAARAAVAAHATLALPVTGRAGVPATNVTAVVMTVTAVSPAVGGSVTAWADGFARPGTSNVSFPAGQNTSVLVTAPVGPDGKVLLYNGTTGSLQLVADVLGYYRADQLPIVASTSHYVRNLTGAASDVSTMNAEGCSDAQANAAGIQHLVLLDVGAQNLSGTTWRVQLSATSTVITDAQLVTAVNGYVDGYASCRSGTDPATIAIGTNNDGATATDRSTAAGTEWANNVVEPVGQHAAAHAGIVIAGANDIEPDFTGLESEAEAWTRAYLAATSAPYVFAGAASGCPTTATAGACNYQWTQGNFYNLAHGISPSRILALPQIYYADNAQQWKYISLSHASGADRIDFIGSLSEFAACQTPGSGCDPDGLLTAAASWQALRTALSSSAAINLQRLPVSTDLRIDSAPGAPASAKRVTTAGVA